jgi:hypothetical protein
MLEFLGVFRPGTTFQLQLVELCRGQMAIGGIMSLTNDLRHHPIIQRTHKMAVSHFGALLANW